jgi:glycosyltransferase involved in cell wall biosynthesis
MAGPRTLKLLLMAQRLNWPPRDPVSQAHLAMVEGLHQAGQQVTFVALDSPRHPVNLRTLPKALRESAEFYAYGLNTNVRAPDVLASFLFGREAYHQQRFVSRNLEGFLRGLMEEGKYDVFQAGSIFFAPYAAALKKASPSLLTVFRGQQAEHELWERRAAREENPVKQYVFTETAQRIKNYEIQTLKSGVFEVLAPLGGREEGAFKALGASKPSQAVAAGVATALFDLPDLSAGTPSIAWEGALDWPPNREGMDWFLREVWPQVHAQYPDCELHLAGSGIPPRYEAIEGVVAEGEIEDRPGFLRRHAIYVMPLLSGGAPRLRMAEALALGRAVLATPLAAEGMGLSQGNQLLLAADAESFAQQLSALIEHPSLRSTLAAHARSFARAQLDNAQLTQRLLDFYRKQLK